jgi:hypothetical protein
MRAEDQQFLLKCDYNEFEQWYKKYLSSIINQPIASLQINYRTYTYNNAKLVPTDSVTTLAQLCR